VETGRECRKVHTEELIIRDSQEDIKEDEIVWRDKISL
jgi:hypothetical protein